MVLGLRIKTKKMDLAVVSAYMPGDHLDPGLSQQTWDSLRVFLRQVPHRCTAIVGIDANGHIGKESLTPALLYLGPKGHTIWTDNGRRLLQVLYDTQMCATNTLSNVEGTTWTWESADTRSRTRIDYILVPVSLQTKIIRNWGVWEDPCLLRQGGKVDHRPLRLSLVIPKPFPRQREAPVARSGIDRTTLLRDLQHVTKVQDNELRRDPVNLPEVPLRVTRLQEAFRGLMESTPVPSTSAAKLAKMEQSMQEALGEVYPLEGRQDVPKKPWMSLSLLSRIRSKAEAWAQCRALGQQYPRGWEQYLKRHVQHCKQVQIWDTPTYCNCSQDKMLPLWDSFLKWHWLQVGTRHFIRSEKQEHRDGIMEEAEGHAVHHNTKEMWRCVHRLSRYKPTITSALRKPDRTRCHNNKEELEVIQQYQQRELRMQSVPTQAQQYPAPTHQEYTPTDVRLALRSQKAWKAVPKRSSPVAAWRLCEEQCIGATCEVWKQSAREGAPPEAWRHHETVHIPKPQKDPTIPDNLRPINLTCPLHRSYLYKLNREMQEHLLHKWRDTTYGALPRRS